MVENGYEVGAIIHYYLSEISIYCLVKIIAGGVFLNKEVNIGRFKFLNGNMDLIFI